MAKIKLNQITSQGGSWEDVTEEGLLGDILLPTEKLRFGKQLENPSLRKKDGKPVRVVVYVRNGENETPEGITLSDDLSLTVRKLVKAGAKKEDLLASLLELRVVSTPDNGLFIVPDFSGVDEFAVKDLKKRKAGSLEDILASLEVATV